MRLSISAFAAVCLFALFVAVDARGQINNLTREELIKYTASNPFDRFPDGRPKIPDALIEKFKDMSSEELLGAGQPPAGDNSRYFGSGPAITYTDGWQILHPGKKLLGRAFTLQLMPTRMEIFNVEQAEWMQKGNVVSLSHQSALDMLQPGDVIAVRRDTRCDGALTLHGAGSPAAGVRLTAYGEGPRPKIVATGKDRQAVDFPGSEIKTAPPADQLRCGLAQRDALSPGVCHHGFHRIILQRKCGSHAYMMPSNEM